MKYSMKKKIKNQNVSLWNRIQGSIKNEKGGEKHSSTALEKDIITFLE